MILHMHLIGLAVLGFTLFAVGLWLGMELEKWLENEGDDLKCRKCGHKGLMAVEYENGGVCLNCLNEILELQGLKEKDNVTPNA